MNKLISVFLLATLAVQGQDSEKSKVYFNKGLQQFALGKSKEAIASFDMAINFDSSNYDAWIKRGFCKGRTGDFEGEMSDYTRVIEVDPKHKWAYISRGSAYNRISKFDEGNIDVLFLDTEGTEWFVLKHLLSRPTIITVEVGDNVNYVNPYIEKIYKLFLFYFYHIPGAPVFEM